MRKFRKAYTGAGVGFVTSLGLALADGNLTVHEFLAAVSVGLLSGAAVYKVKNEV